MRARFGFIIIINVLCAVNIRGHEANFYEAEARCHEAEIEAEARKSEAENRVCSSHAHGVIDALLGLSFVYSIIGFLHILWFTR